MISWRTYCGVRFFRFEDKYTVVQQCKTLTVDVKDKDFESPMDGFRWIYPEGNRAKALSGRDYELNKLRWRMCLQYGRTNHNQYSIYFKHWGRAKSPKLAPAFTEKRPELFAKGKGTVCGVDNILRVNYPDDSDIPSHLCYSNQDTVRYYANEVLTYAKGGNVLGGWGNQFGNYPVTKLFYHEFRENRFSIRLKAGILADTAFAPPVKNAFRKIPRTIFPITSFSLFRMLHGGCENRSDSRSFDTCIYPDSRIPGLGDISGKRFCSALSSFLFMVASHCVPETIFRL